MRCGFMLPPTGGGHILGHGAGASKSPRQCALPVSRPATGREESARGASRGPRARPDHPFARWPARRASPRVAACHRDRAPCSRKSLIGSRGSESTHRECTHAPPVLPRHVADSCRSRSSASWRGRSHEALRIDAAPGLAPGGWPAMLQLVATAAAIVGTSLALVFPAFALARHRRGGALRFHGLPEWAVALALAGTATLAAGFIVQELVPMLPIDARMTAMLDRAAGHRRWSRAHHRGRALRGASASQRRARACRSGRRAQAGRAGSRSPTRPSFARALCNGREATMNARNYWIGVASKDHVDIGSPAASRN